VGKTMTRSKPLSARICGWAVALLAAAYAFALAVFLTGEFGLLGQARSPLAGVYLVPLGLPWNHAIDSLPEASWPWLGAAAPLINLGILAALCRFLGFRRQSSKR
jgi:drug/metabolite transporter superfamily protein YnfA